MRLRVGRPADPSQGVDERAALDPKGATDRGFRRTAVERRDDGRHFFDVDRNWTTAAPTATSGCFQTGSHPLPGQRPLKLSQRPEDMKQKFTLRSGGIHLLGQRPERDPAFLEVVYSREQVGERSPETIELPHHKAITRLEERQRRGKACAIVAGAAGTIFKQVPLIDPCRQQGVALQVQDLAIAVG